jgi:hypothetical protein
MRTRTVLATTAAAIAFTATAPLAAEAKTAEYLDKRIFDATPAVTAGSWHLNGMTAGPIGPTLDVTVTAADGTFPTTSNACEPVDVVAVLTLAPGEVLTVRTTGEACAPFFGGIPAVNAYFGDDETEYQGTAHKKVKIEGDGLISAGGSFLGYQATINASVKW